MPLFCRVDVVKIGADACRCVPMRADAVDAVISHTHWAVIILRAEGLFTPFVYVAEKAVKDIQVSKAQASLVISVLGVSNTVGRVVAGLLADRSWVDAVLLHNVAAVAAGLLTCLVSVIFSFELLCIYAALFGALIGSRFCC